MKYRRVTYEDRIRITEFIRAGKLMLDDRQNDRSDKKEIRD
mgnify:CR=1 FL=1